jgi:cell division protein FtsQ
VASSRHTDAVPAEGTPRGSGQAPQSTAGVWLPSSRSILVALGLLVAGIGGYFIARETPIFSIQQIEVEGATPEVAARVRTALRPVVGSSLVAFDSREANRRLVGVAEVADATYDRSFPHTLRVVVRTELPVALLRRGHEAWLVSGSARVLRQVVQRPLPDLPRVWLPPSEDPLPGAVLDEPAATAVRALVPLRGAHLRARIRSVRAVDGELTLLLASGIHVLLGDASRLRLKLAAAARILPEVGDATYLDVSVPERAVAGTTPVP